MDDSADHVVMGASEDGFRFLADDGAFTTILKRAHRFPGRRAAGFWCTANRWGYPVTEEVAIAVLTEFANLEELAATRPIEYFGKPPKSTGHGHCHLVPGTGQAQNDHVAANR